MSQGIPGRQYLKAGKVVRIRVNPRDVIRCVDFMNKLGVSLRYTSFDQVVRLTLSSLLDLAQQNDLIPEPDEFSYSEKVAQFEGIAQSVKLRTTELYDRQADNVQNPRLPSQRPTLDLDGQKAGRVLGQLMMKREADPDNWDTVDQKRWDKCVAIQSGEYTLAPGEDI